MESAHEIRHSCRTEHETQHVQQLQEILPAFCPSSAELPLPQTEGLWRVGAQIAPDLTLSVFVGSPENYSEVSGIRFLA